MVGTLEPYLMGWNLFELLVLTDVCVCLREGGGHTKTASLLHAARKSMSYPVKLSLPNIFTSRKRSLGQGNVFTPVCQSFCSQWPPKRVVRILLEYILVSGRILYIILIKN